MTPAAKERQRLLEDDALASRRLKLPRQEDRVAGQAVDTIGDGVACRDKRPRGLLDDGAQELKSTRKKRLAGTARPAEWRQGLQTPTDMEVVLKALIKTTLSKAWTTVANREEHVEAMPLGLPRGADGTETDGAAVSRWRWAADRQDGLQLRAQ